jgi:hypothetical protein
LKLEKNKRNPNLTLRPTRAHEAARPLLVEVVAAALCFLSPPPPASSLTDKRAPPVLSLPRPSFPFLAPRRQEPKRHAPGQTPPRADRAWPPPRQAGLHLTSRPRLARARTPRPNAPCPARSPTAQAVPLTTVLLRELWSFNSTGSPSLITLSLH